MVTDRSAWTKGCFDQGCGLMFGEVRRKLLCFFFVIVKKSFAAHLWLGYMRTLNNELEAGMQYSLDTPLILSVVSCIFLSSIHIPSSGAQGPLGPDPTEIIFLATAGRVTGPSCYPTCDSVGVGAIITGYRLNMIRSVLPLLMILCHQNYFWRL